MYLVNDPIPGKACVVDDDMYLSIAELCSLLYQCFQVLVIEYVSHDCYCTTTIFFDLVRYFLGLFYRIIGQLPWIGYGLG